MEDDVAQTRKLQPRLNKVELYSLLEQRRSESSLKQVLQRPLQVCRNANWDPAFQSQFTLH